MLLFLDGGGFVVGDIESHDGLCRMICRDAAVHVLSVDYRLAPEHTAPAAADDCVAAYRWALAHAVELGVSRIGLGGDSAGGNLAANDARVSPVNAADLSGLAPALALTAGFDPLRDEGNEYAEALRSAGILVDHRQFDGLTHLSRG